MEEKNSKKLAKATIVVTILALVFPMFTYNYGSTIISSRVLLNLLAMFNSQQETMPWTIWNYLFVLVVIGIIISLMLSILGFNKKFNAKFSSSRIYLVAGIISVITIIYFIYTNIIYKPPSEIVQYYNRGVGLGLYMMILAAVMQFISAKTMRISGELSKEKPSSEIL